MYKQLCFDFWILPRHVFITFHINNVLNNWCFGFSFNNYYQPYYVFFLHNYKKLDLETKGGNMNMLKFYPSI